MRTAGRQHQPKRRSGQESVKCQLLASFVVKHGDRRTHNVRSVHGRLPVPELEALVAVPHGKAEHDDTVGPVKVADQAVARSLADLVRQGTGNGLKTYEDEQRKTELVVQPAPL